MIKNYSEGTMSESLTHNIFYIFLLYRLNFLDKRLQAGMPSSRGEDWQPLLLYRNSLLHGETDQVPVTSKRAYTRRKKDLAGKILDFTYFSLFFFSS